MTFASVLESWFEHVQADNWSDYTISNTPTTKTDMCASDEASHKVPHKNQCCSHKFGSFVMVQVASLELSGETYCIFQSLRYPNA